MNVLLWLGWGIAVVEFLVLTLIAVLLVKKVIADEEDERDEASIEAVREAAKKVSMARRAHTAGKGAPEEAELLVGVEHAEVELLAAGLAVLDLAEEPAGQAVEVRP